MACFICGCRLCEPSYDSWSGKLIKPKERFPNSLFGPMLESVPVIFTALGDTLRAVGSTINCHKWSKQARKDHVKNLAATISLFVQAPLMLCWIVTPQTDRLTLFCREDLTLKTQINDCNDELDQRLFERNLRSNPNLRDKLVKVECSPHSPLVNAIEGDKIYLANKLLKDHGAHRHVDNPSGFCHAWHAVAIKVTVSFVEYERELICGLLGDVLVKNYLDRVEKPEIIYQSDPALQQEVDKERQESDNLIINKDIDYKNYFGVSFVDHLLINVRETITGMSKWSFRYPDNKDNFELLDNSLLAFVALNKQLENVKSLLDNGMNINELDSESFSPLESLFLKYDVIDKGFYRADDVDEAGQRTIRKNRPIVEMAKLLISQGAIFHDKDLEDPKLMKYIESTDADTMREEENKLALSEGENSVYKNRYFRCFPRSKYSVYKLNFWRKQVEELREASQQAFNVYYKVIVGSLDSGFPTEISKLIAQYLRPGSS